MGAIVGLVCLGLDLRSLMGAVAGRDGFVARVGFEGGSVAPASCWGLAWLAECLAGRAGDFRLVAACLAGRSGDGCRVGPSAAECRVGLAWLLAADDSPVDWSADDSREDDWSAGDSLGCPDSATAGGRPVAGWRR